MSAQSPIAHAVASDIETIGTSFTLTAAQETDIWRKPPTTDVLNAPINFTHIADASSISSATVTYNLNSRDFIQKYDQAGIFLYYPATKAWIKAGIEVTDDRHSRFLSTVVTMAEASDWSIYPCPCVKRFEEICNPMRKVDVRVSRGEEGGAKIEVRYQNGAWEVIREVNAIFSGNQELEKEGVWIGGYVARPAKEGGDLVVQFDGLVVEKL